MKKSEARQLANGIYQVFWKEDTSFSLAAIGMLSNGDKWLAPINWIEPTVNQNIWRSVKEVRRLI